MISKNKQRSIAAYSFIITRLASNRISSLRDKISTRLSKQSQGYFTRQRFFMPSSNKKSFGAIWQFGGQMRLNFSLKLGIRRNFCLLNSRSPVAKTQRLETDYIWFTDALGRPLHSRWHDSLLVYSLLPKCHILVRFFDSRSRSIQAWYVR